MTSFQSRVSAWLVNCFGDEAAKAQKERNHRFLEESLELAQACGATQAEAHQLVDYVFSRDKGEVAQEVGGVMLTLAGLCYVHGIDMAELGEAELARVATPEMIERIKYKASTKPTNSPLPGAYPECRSLDQKLRDAGMVTVAELMAGSMLDGFIKHNQVNDIPSLFSWVEMRRSQFALRKIPYDLGEKDESDDMYEWILAHYAVFTEIHINMKEALNGKNT